MSSMFCEKIYQCRNADWCARDFNPKSDEPECFEQTTNYDRVIHKTPEELAVWMNGIIKERNIEVTCDGWLAWLKAPADEEAEE